jgi:hypothetical protein
VRQWFVADLGHEDPTVLLTKHFRRAPAAVIGR